MATELTVYVPFLSAHVKVLSQPNHTVQDIIEEVARGVAKNNVIYSAEELIQFGIFKVEGLNNNSNDHVLVNFPPLDFDRKISSLEVCFYP